MRKSRHHTRSGPGRFHGQGRAIITTKLHFVGIVKPRQRLAPAAYGGNWKGAPYLSMREHDMYTRLRRMFPGLAPVSHDQALSIIEAARPS